MNNKTARQDLETVIRIEDLSVDSMRKLRAIQDWLRGQANCAEGGAFTNTDRKTVENYLRYLDGIEAVDVGHSVDLDMERDLVHQLLAKIDTARAQGGAVEPVITNEMKAECMGEFEVSVTQDCGRCLVEGLDENCEQCDGELVYQRIVTVPWDLCKEIYKAMAKFDPSRATHPPAPAQGVPEGYALVPVHATADMVRRGKRAHGEEFLFHQDPDSNIQGIWKAMLAIAPQPPEAPNHPSGEQSTSPGDGWVRCEDEALSKVLEEIAAERQRQDGKWGGPDHDDQKSANDFVQHAQDYAGWARVMAGMGSLEKYRRRMMQVAALAVAAVQATDRALKRPQPPKDNTQEGE